jgi:hypothetical protein
MGFKEKVTVQMEADDAEALKTIVAPNLGRLARRRFFRDVEFTGNWAASDAHEEPVPEVVVALKPDQAMAIVAAIDSEIAAIEHGPTTEMGYRTLGEHYRAERLRAALPTFEQAAASLQ